MRVGEHGNKTEKEKQKLNLIYSVFCCGYEVTATEIAYNSFSLSYTVIIMHFLMPNHIVPSQSGKCFKEQYKFVTYTLRCPDIQKHGFNGGNITPSVIFIFSGHLVVYYSLHKLQFMCERSREWQ